MSTPTLGKHARGGDEVRIYVDRLVEGRLLVQANSGGGKSWALRRLLEQTHGHLQQLVIDVEGEFYTLREHYDYILARAGNEDRDCPAEPRSAHLLARKLLELGVSAIVDIYELHVDERYAFVRRFLEAMLGAPRQLWHPVLVVVDEAHLFCPQTGSVESAHAVIDLMTRGRKRGYAGVLATQRLSKLHKDAAAECNTKLIGRTGLDVDMRRAGEELGLEKKDHRLLRDLSPGTFYAFGPALSTSVIEVEVGDVRTAHPRSGQRSAPTPPPRGRVQAVLGELADLPAVAVEEARTVAALEAEVRDLQRELAKARAEGLPAAAALERERARAVADSHRVAEALRSDVEKRCAAALKLLDQVVDTQQIERLFALLSDISAQAAEARGLVQAVLAAPSAVVPELTAMLRQPWPSALEEKLEQMAAAVPEPVPDPPPPIEPVRAVRRDREQGRVERAPHGKTRALEAIAQMYPARLTEARWATMAGLKRRGGTWQKYLRELRAEDLVEESGGTFCATPLGLSAVGEVPARPRTPEDHLAFWAQKRGMRNAVRLAKAVLDHGAVTKRDLARLMQLEVSGGTFQAYVRQCVGAGLVEAAGDTVRPGECLRD